MPTVFVVGSLNVDQLLEVAAYPAAGETVLASDVRVSAGGKGGNQAVAAARAGAAVVMIGALGDDEGGRLVRTALSDSGVDTRHVRTVVGAPSGTALVLLDPDGENRIIVAPGANARLSGEDVELGLERIREGDLLLLQLETPPHIVSHAARLAAQRGATVVLNAAPAPRDATCLTADLDFLVVNRGEMHAVAQLLDVSAHLDETTPLPAVVTATARALSHAVVCTTGSDGAYLSLGGDEDVVHVPAVPVTATDTTAAGDTYTGYLAAALAAGETELPKALAKAAAAAALAVTRPGAMSSIPYAHESDQTSGAELPGE